VIVFDSQFCLYFNERLSVPRGDLVGLRLILLKS